jgi:methyl-accepting chemotaxis protein
MQFIRDLSIKIKIGAGFGLMQLIIAVISVSALMNLSAVQQDVVSIAEEIQPAVLRVDELAFRLEKANSSLGFYLLSKEDSHKQHYLESLRRADEILNELRALILVQQDVEIAAAVSSIAMGVDEFKGYQQRMLHLATSVTDNIPATAFVSEKINPLNQQVLQLLGDMILNEKKAPVSEARRNLLIDLGEVRYSWSNVMSGMRSFLASRQTTALGEVNLHLGGVGEALDAVLSQKRLLSREQAAALAKIIPLQDEFAAMFGRLVATHGDDAWRTDAHLIRTEIGPLLDGIGLELDDLGDKLHDKITYTSDALVEAVNATNTLVGTLLVLGMVLGVVIAWGIMKIIVAPLQVALAAMADVVGGGGDLTHRLDDVNKDETGKLAHGFNMFAGMVHGIVKDIMGYTDRLSQSVDRLRVITEETSRGVDKQQMQTDDVVAAVNELAATGQEVARNTTEAAAAAQNAEQASSQGRKVVDKTIDDIGLLAEEIERAGEVINRLEADSDAIGGVLDVIRGIAEQTNLLALNAAIEAARAGEQGRGFAVVADEVRTLASRTQASTSEIQVMIERLQTGSQKAVKGMEKSKERANATVDQAVQAGAALQEISAAVTVINEMNVQIATAAEEQNTVAESINVAVVSISEITEQTSAGAQQTASASNELNNLAERISCMVKQFKV